VKYGCGCGCGCEGRVKCQCGVRERLCAGSGQVKSSQVKSSQVRSSPSPVPFQFQFQFRSQSQSQSQSQKETEGAGHSAGFMPFDRLEGMWPGRERLSLCNAATGNGRSLRCGRQRRQRGGAGGVGCGLWAAGCWLLATGYWLLAAGCWLPWGSLSCQLAMALALAQASPTANTQPASSTPGPHVKPARPLFRSLGPSKQPVFHQRQPTTIGSTTASLVSREASWRSRARTRQKCLDAHQVIRFTTTTTSTTTTHHASSIRLLSMLAAAKMPQVSTNN
jgi:hypothetical protein